MNRVLMLSILFCIFLFSCESKPPSLQDQLREVFISRLKKSDSTVILDSFRIVRVDSLDQKHQRMIDDSIYMREFIRVRNQLTNSIAEKRTDSIEYYRDEVKYMESELDSMKKEISKADTTKKISLLALCKIQLSKNNRRQEMSLRYLIDLNMNIWNTSMIDSSIARTVRKMN